MLAGRFFLEFLFSYYHYNNNNDINSNNINNNTYDFEVIVILIMFNDFDDDNTLGLLHCTFHNNNNCFHKLELIFLFVVR